MARHLAGRRSDPLALGRRLPPRALAAGIGIVGVVLAGLAMVGLARAAEPVDLSVSSSERYFSPDGDGQEDTTTVSYCLSQAANLDIWVTDGSGARVRTLEAGVSHSASPCGGSPTSFGWDGKDDGGRVVGDGIYTVHLIAHAAEAESGDVTRSASQIRSEQCRMRLRLPNVASTTRKCSAAPPTCPSRGGGGVIDACWAHPPRDTSAHPG
jgi:FlgD Ig-like domain